MPYNLITSLPRTSFPLSLPHLSRVRRSPISPYPTFKLSCENLFCFAYWFCARRSRRVLLCPFPAGSPMTPASWGVRRMLFGSSFLSRPRRFPAEHPPFPQRDTEPLPKKPTLICPAFASGLANILPFVCLLPRILFGCSLSMSMNTFLYPLP